MPTVPLPGLADTIVALATPAGRGALAIIRLSGPAADDVAGHVVHPWPTAPRAATRCVLRDARGERLDEAIVVRFPAPRSFTGETVVEITTHGGVAVASSVLAALAAAGARPALPGEFTRRAVLNGKLDVIQAEAVGDLTDARTRGAQRAALAQLDGGLSRRVAALREALLEIEALVAYDVDFPEEDDGPVPRARVLAAVDGTLARLHALLATARPGELVREGALVVIAGAPNAGKSSLFNALLGRARALVTEIPGTTRDALEAVLDLGRWPVRLVDTAGLRETSDVVERLGIEVSERYLRDAELVLACAEDDGELARTVAICRAQSAAPVIAVRTKSDLATVSPPASGAIADAVATVSVSAEFGEGLAALTAAVERTLDEATAAPPPDVPLLTHARQVRAIAAAREELASFRHAWHDESLPATVAAVHLRQAVHELEELVGAVGVEEVLERVFAAFCVGK